jgi:hypothetical protein
MEIVLSQAEMYTLPDVVREAARAAARRLRAAFRVARCALLGGACLAAAASRLDAQPARRAPAAARGAPAALPRDVATIDGIVRAFYEVVSGPPGRPRQWRRDSTLYLPSHRFHATGGRAGDGGVRVMDHAAFAALTDSLLTPHGFHEREVRRIAHRFGNVAHVLSSYESRTTPDGPVTGRGVNSLQLVWDGARWWIASTAWDAERPDNPLPPALSP